MKGQTVVTNIIIGIIINCIIMITIIISTIIINYDIKDTSKKIARYKIDNDEYNDGVVAIKIVYIIYI